MIARLSPAVYQASRWGAAWIRGRRRRAPSCLVTDPIADVQRACVAPSREPTIAPARPVNPARSSPASASTPPQTRFGFNAEHGCQPEESLVGANEPTAQPPFCPSATNTAISPTARHTAVSVPSSATHPRPAPMILMPKSLEVAALADITPVRMAADFGARRMATRSTIGRARRFAPGTRAGPRRERR